MADQPTTVHVEFYVEAIENPAKSKTAGRPIFEDQEFIRIRFPGDKNRIHVAPAHEGYRRDKETNDWVTYAEDYPRHYAAFREHKEFIGDGTPLSELPFLTEAKRAELRALNVHTAEQLAGLDGAFLQKLGMGARALKTQAEAFIEKASGGAVEARLSAENAALKERLEALSAQVAAMDNDGDSRPARRGRPPKNEQAEAA